MKKPKPAKSPPPDQVKETLYLRPELFARLLKAEKQTGIKRQEINRIAIDRYLREMGY